MSHLDRVPGELNLFIGGLFTLRRREAVQEANMTHVLSVLSCDGRSLFDGHGLVCKVVEVDDVEDENLLEYFPATNKFIQEGLDGGGGVLVHCAMGKSRSATCIIAYLLSIRSDLNVDSALALLREARPLAEPNDGFMQQLRLYHHMGCPSTDEELAQSPPYQRWLYHREVESARSIGQAPQVDRIRFEDEPATSQVSKRHEKCTERGVVRECGADERGAVELKCKKCRRTLATSPFILPHVPARFGGQTSPPPAGLTITPTRRGDGRDGVAGERASADCAHHFVDPLSWMREELGLGKTEGRLECPNQKCGNLVGKYAWHGLRCSCGGWEVPGISLAKGRVDEMRVRKSGGGGGGGVGSVAEGLASIRRGPGVPGHP